MRYGVIITGGEAREQVQLAREAEALAKALEESAAKAPSEPTEEGKAQAAHYREVAAQIHREVCEQGVDAALGCFVQAYGSQEMDASLLQIALTGFLPADDPRFLATLAQIERRLQVFFALPFGQQSPAQLLPQLLAIGELP